MKNFSGWIKFGTSIAACVLAVLMFVLTFVDIDGTKPKNAYDAEATHNYIKDLSDAPHPFGYWNTGDFNDSLYIRNLLGVPISDAQNLEKLSKAHEKNRKYIVDELKSFGLADASYTEESYDATIRKLSFVETLQGVTDFSQENAHLIPDEKFPLDIQEIEDAEYKQILKQNYVANYVETKNTIENFKLQLSSLTQDSAEYNDIINQTYPLIQNLGYIVDTSKKLTNQLMPDFNDTISPFVIEYNRYLTNEESNVLHELSGNEKENIYEENIVSDYMQNIIAYFPSRETIEKGNKTTSDILAFVCHYDSVNDGPGAVDDNAALAGLMSACKKLAKDYESSSNDICFIFTDAEEKGLWGIKSLYHLNSMSNFFNRLSLILNFEGRGTSGTVAMFETSANNRKLISSYSKSVNSTVYSSSFATFVYNLLPNVTDMNFILNLAKKDIASPAVLNFANIGSGENYHTENDTFENMTLSIPAQVHAVANNAITTYRDYDLNQLTAKTDAVYFSYYDLFMINYSPVWGYIFGIIALGLGVAFFVLNAKRKCFNTKNLAKGLAVQAIILVACALIFFIGGLFVFLIATSALGIESFGAFAFEYTYSKLFAVAIIAVIAVIACYFLYKLFAKIFKVSGKDIAIGANFLILALSVVLSFATPSASYIFIFTAILSQAINLCELLFDSKLNKHNLSFNSLNLHILPFILTMFMPLSLGLMFTEALGHIAYPIFGLFFALIIGAFVPTFNAKTFFDSIISPFKKTNKADSEYVAENN